MKYYIYVTDKEENTGYEPTLYEYDTTDEIREWFLQLIREECYDGYNYKIIVGEEQNHTLFIDKITLTLT